MEEPDLTAAALDAAAIEKAGLHIDWKPFLYESAVGGILVTNMLRP